MRDCSEPDRVARLRNLARTDLYFLLRYVCGRADIERQWLFERCREVQAEPNGYLDLWSREHYKSTIITFGLSILDILATHGDDPIRGPEVTIGMFSHTRPIAKAFLRQIKLELERNTLLKSIFPDILHENVNKAERWSEDNGIVVKRKGNPKEATVEAWGLIDGQPTSKHYNILLYDDVVTRESVTTPEMIKKTTEAYQLSDNLGTEGGSKRLVGTRYHFADTYREIIASGAVKVRQYPCTHDGTETFTPENCVLMSPETLIAKRRNQGIYTFGTQMLLNPKGDALQGFQESWLRFLNYPVKDTTGLNVYLLVDPANSKKASADYTTMVAIGLGSDENYVLLDLYRDRLNLAERTRLLFTLHRRWRPIVVGYEQYGMQADIQHIREEQNRANYRFGIIELSGSTPKNDRIKRLIPIFEQGRFYMPPTLYKTNWEGETVDVIEQFIEEEYKPFPVPIHDDMLDDLARIVDPQFPAVFPAAQGFAGAAFENCEGYDPLSRV